MTRIGIITSGGDCPGLNSVIRSIVRSATLSRGWEVVGIPDATQGLMEQRSIPLTAHGLDFHGIDPLMFTGGTFLGTVNHGNTAECGPQLDAGYRALGLDALVVVGGDGSLGIINTLAIAHDWTLIGIPKTIDGDIAFTERCIGFDTAVNTVTDALNHLTFTAASHDRVMVVEVMGRTAGHLALQAGIAGGADVVLVPEIPWSIEGISSHLDEQRTKWTRKHAIVVVAEGIAHTSESAGALVARKIREVESDRTEVRVSVLGHIQRGGLPLALDRLTAAAFGKAAVDLIAEGKRSVMVGWKGRGTVAVPLVDVVANSPLLVSPDDELVSTARSLGMYVGD